MNADDAAPGGVETDEPTPDSESGGAEVEVTRKRFDEFELPADVLTSLGKMGITTCTPIQEKVLGRILEGVDVVAKAETGTGKTLGFGAPLVGKIDTQRVAVQAMVLTPTRELAQQVAQVLEELGQGRDMRVALLVGGVHASEQIETLRKGSQLAVGTPGRVLDFLKERILSLGWCETVVLDEADRMLDMGFIDEVGAILDRIPPERQTLLFSATMPQGVNKLLERYMRNPEHYSTARGISTTFNIAQGYLQLHPGDKLEELRKVLDGNPDDTAIVFCNTRRQAIDLDRMLWGNGYSAGSLHGDQEQEVRFKILEAFRSGDIKTLVATDVASRGLDIEAVTRVINYDVPDEVESYVHRIGRTGRASSRGIALTFVSRKELRSWQQVLEETGFEIELVGEERFDVTQDTGGRGDWGGRGRGGRGDGGRQGSGGRGSGGRGSGGRGSSGRGSSGRGSGGGRGGSRSEGGEQGGGRGGGGRGDRQGDSSRERESSPRGGRGGKRREDRDRGGRGGDKRGGRDRDSSRESGRRGRRDRKSRAARTNRRSTTSVSVSHSTPVRSVRPI